MIFAIAIDPLSQQLISYSYTSIPDPGVNATIGISHEWDEMYTSRTGTFRTPGLGRHVPLDAEIFTITNPRLGASDAAISSGMKGAILSGLYSETKLIKDATPFCPRSNCTFEPYMSLAVCSSIADISSHVAMRTVNTSSPGLPQLRYYASTHQYLSGDTFSFMNVSSAAWNFARTNASKGAIVWMRFPDSVAFKSVSDPIADVIAIYQTNETDENQRPLYGAAEFVLEWCVKNFTTIVRDGVATTQSYNSYRNFNVHSSEFDNVSTTYQGQKYSITPGTHYSLQRYLAHLFQGYISQATYGWFASSDSVESLFQPFDYFTGDLSAPRPNNTLQRAGQPGLEHIVSNIATSMTT